MERADSTWNRSSRSTPCPRASAGGISDQTGALFGMVRTLFFCVPPNPQLLGYWDTVADRLFKIRNSENIQGVFQQLPLFDPPLDPGMLVKAAAAGIDIGSIVSGLNQPLSAARAFARARWLSLRVALPGLHRADEPGRISGHRNSCLHKPSHVAGRAQRPAAGAHR